MNRFWTALAIGYVLTVTVANAQEREEERRALYGVPLVAAGSGLFVATAAIPKRDTRHC